MGSPLSTWPKTQDDFSTRGRTMLRRIRVVPHDALWSGSFAAESTALAAAFGGSAREIHHVGSTSIPGLPAKPIIDILVVVADIGQVDSLNPTLIALGYEPQGEYGIPGRRFFTKGGDVKRSHQVHVFQQDHPEVSAMLDFRDYLRSHPGQAAEYGRLKERLAHLCADDIRAYNAGKDAFVKELIRQARIWRQGTNLAPEDRQG
jgi:GrpB-like predicted nucleotidyltransferase (UPF0157 family)